MSEEWLSNLTKGDRVIVNNGKFDEKTITHTSKRYVWIGNLKFDRNTGHRIIPQGYSLLRIESYREQRLQKSFEARNKKLSLEEVKAIRKASPEWLKNAIDLTFLTGQRLSDILNMKFEDIKNGYLQVIQQKTGYKIKFILTDSLKEIIQHCPNNSTSPFLIQLGKKDYQTSIKVHIVNSAFTSICKNILIHRYQIDRPLFHEICQLSLQLYKNKGKDLKIFRVNSIENNLKSHEMITWSEVIPDLDINLIL